MYVLRPHVLSVEVCVRLYGMNPAGPEVGSGSRVMTEPGQRGMAFSAYARSAAMSARCAKAEKGRKARRARRRPSEKRFMSLRINRPVSPFNPAFDSPLHVHDVAEAGHGEQLRGHRAVGGGLAVDEHGLVLVRQQLRQLALDGVERRVERAGDVAFGAAEVGLGADVEDHHLRAVEDHLRGDGRRDLGVAARGARDADGATRLQNAECRRQNDQEPPSLHFCIPHSAFCIHNHSNSNSARTSPTSVPATLRSAQSRKRCSSAAPASTPRSSSVLMITGSRPRVIDPSFTFKAMPMAASSATTSRPVNPGAAPMAYNPSAPSLATRSPPNACISGVVMLHAPATWYGFEVIASTTCAALSA